MDFTNTLEFIKQNCPKYDGTGNSNDLITWLRRIKPHVMYLRGNEPRRVLEFLLVGDAKDYYLSLEARPPSVLEMGGIFCPKLDQDGTLRHQFQRSTSTLSSNVQLTRQPPRPGTPETLEITNALSAPSSHSARPHHFHSQHERDYFLAKSISSSSDSTLVSTPSINTLQCTEVDSFWPEGLTSWLSAPLPPRSPPVLSDDAVFASPATLCSSIPEQGTRINFPSATYMVSSPISKIDLASTFLFVSPLRQSLQLSFSVIFPVLLLLIGFTLTFDRLSSSIDRGDTALKLLPVQQLWHVMVP
jgi:hypothetical protein